jgi:deoxyribose-phosphate aldolase
MPETVTDPIALLDLTSLDEGDTHEVVRALCAKAQTPHGPVAAVCILPGLVPVAVEALAGAPVLVATVANFPAGANDPAAAAAETASAVAAGADEVDVVAPWRAHAEDPEAVARLVEACRVSALDRILKVILETGSHPDPAATRAMADAALAAGADFLKTSTGKHGPGASPEAARVLLEAVRDAGAGGVKVSGGVRTAEQARTYLALADEVMGAGWATPATFRIGASSLLDVLLAER